MSPRILVVDDDSSVRQTICALLTHFGAATLEASDGTVALEIYRREGSLIDAVFLDRRMPGLTGEEVLAVLRALDPAVRCCLMSGSGLTGAFETGAITTLTKPFRMDDIRDALAILLA
jgi:two-component system OmpR family response regulator